MTEQGEEVRVEPNQLRGKADELQDVAVDVSARPTSPCALTFVQSATAQIVAAANTLQSYVASGNAEATRLSEVLNEAAGVYDKVDEDARRQLEETGQRWPVGPVPVNPVLSPPVPAIDIPPFMAPMAGGDTGGYVDMKAAAQMLESGNTGPLTAYAADAKAFANSLRARAESFSLGGVTWDGSSAEAAGEALLQHHDWLIKVAEQYDGLAAEAEEFVSDHRHAVSTHPKLDEIETVEQRWTTRLSEDPPIALG